jgi:hypothetical protein
MRGFYMDEAFTGSPSDLQHISHDTNFTAKQWVDNTSASLAPIEATSTASQPYAVGKRLVYGGRLYKVTQAIAQGGTLTPGTNIVLDSVDSELDTINTHLSDVINDRVWRARTFTNQSVPSNSFINVGFAHNIGKENVVLVTCSNANVSIGYANKTNNSVTIIIQNSGTATVTTDVDVLVIPKWYGQ